MPDDPKPPAPPAPPEPPVDPPKSEPKSEPDPKLGEGGERALAAERQARKAAEKAAREAQAELDSIREANQTAEEKALKDAKNEGRKEALTSANKRLVRAEVRAAAAGKITDPSDAVAFLDLDQFEIDEDGNVDDKAITSAIDELMAAKPYLATGAKPAVGSGDGGARTPAPDLSIDQQIKEAETKGDFRTSARLKSLRLAQHMTS